MQCSEALRGRCIRLAGGDPLCGVSEKAGGGELVRWPLGALEYGVCLGDALAMWTREEVRDDRDRLLRKQLRAVPPHLDTAVRACGRFEMLRRASETINHGAPRVFGGHN